MDLDFPTRSGVFRCSVKDFNGVAPIYISLGSAPMGTYLPAQDLILITTWESAAMGESIDLPRLVSHL